MIDDGVRERHGFMARDSMNNRSPLTVFERDDEACVPRPSSDLYLTPAEARYLARQLYRVARRIDALGAALSELSFAKIVLDMERNDDGSIKRYAVTLFHDNECSFGEAATPSDALEGALKRYASKLAARVERAAEREIAA